MHYIIFRHVVAKICAYMGRNVIVRIIVNSFKFSSWNTFIYLSSRNLALVCKSILYFKESTICHLKYIKFVLIQSLIPDFLFKFEFLPLIIVKISNIGLQILISNLFSVLLKVSILWSECKENHQNCIKTHISYTTWKRLDRTKTLSMDRVILHIER